MEPAIRKALRLLTFREREVLQRRFGIDRERQTLADIASEFNASIGMVRILESKAKLKLGVRSKAEFSEIYRKDFRMSNQENKRGEIRQLPFEPPSTYLPDLPKPLDVRIRLAQCLQEIKVLRKLLKVYEGLPKTKSQTN